MALFLISIPVMILAIAIAVVPLVVVSRSENRRPRAATHQDHRLDVVSPTGTGAEEPAVPLAA